MTITSQIKISFAPSRLCVIILSVVCVANVVDAAPNITNMSIRGLQIGGTTTVVIQGSDLLPDPKLVLGVPVAKQEIVGKPVANRVEFKLTLGDKITPGLYNLRLANANGISGIQVVAVDKLTQLPLAAQVKTLPAALHGSLTGSTISRTTFTGKRDERFVAEVEAQRLGGKLRPVLHLYDSRRRQIAWAMATPTLSGDTRLVAKLPADGEYTIELHDLQYAGAASGHFRLKIGSFDYVDLVFPPAVELGKKTSLQLIGNLTEAKPVELTAAVDGTPLPAPWPVGTTPSGARPKVLVSSMPEMLEAPSGEGPQQLPQIPVAVSGRLDASGQEDVYRLAVAEGTKLRLEVFADRIGSPVDGVLEIRNDKGARLAQNDDVAGTADPRIDYTVAKGITTIDVAVKDLLDHDPRQSIYRLVIAPLDGKSKRPSFQLGVSQDTHNVPRGDTTVFRVEAERDGYDGPIKISFDNLPQGVTATAADISAGTNATLVTLTAPKKGTAHMVTSIRGASVGLNPQISAVASLASHPLGEIQPWLKNDVAVAMAAANTVPFHVEWNQLATNAPLALGTKFKAPVKFIRPPGAIGPVRLSLISGHAPPLVNGKPNVNQSVRAERATVDIPVDPKAKAALDALIAAKKAETDAQAKAKAMIDAGQKAVTAAQTLVKQLAATSDAAQKTLADAKAKAKDTDQAKADAEKAVADSQAAVDAAEKALADAVAKVTSAQETFVKLNATSTAMVKDASAKRVAAEKAASDAEAKIKNVAEFNVIVPPNLAIAPYDLALRAELRSVDNKTLLAQVFTPVKRFPALNPLAIKLSGEPKFETKLDAKTGATVKLTGMIERKAGFGGNVTVTIAGQPGGVAVPKVVLKPDKSDFALELKFPANFKPAEIKTIKLQASGSPDAKVANIVVKTETPITVNILAADPPAK